MTKAAELAKMGEVLTNGQVGGRRNMVINGAMQIAQRGTSGFLECFTTNATYTLDRYKVFCPAASFTLSQSMDHLHFLSFIKKDKVLLVPSSGQGGNIFTGGNSVSQLNWGTSNAKTATLSFYVRANNTGTYCVNLSKC